MSLAAVPVYLLVRRLGRRRLGRARGCGPDGRLAGPLLLVVPARRPDRLPARARRRLRRRLRALAEPSRRLQLASPRWRCSRPSRASSTSSCRSSSWPPHSSSSVARCGRSGRASGSRCCSMPHRWPWPPCSGPKRVLGYYSGVADRPRQARRDRPLARHRRHAARVRGRLRARPGRDRRHRVRPLEAELARGVRVRRASPSGCCSASSPRRRSTRRTAPTASRSAT